MLVRTHVQFEEAESLRRCRGVTSRLVDYIPGHASGQGQSKWKFKFWGCWVDLG